MVADIILRQMCGILQNKTFAPSLSLDSLELDDDDQGLRSYRWVVSGALGEDARHVTSPPTALPFY